MKFKTVIRAKAKSLGRGTRDKKNSGVRKKPHLITESEEGTEYIPQRDREENLLQIYTRTPQLSL